uniref:Uncharacterized protein n=1 Tax=Cebus imitator TaxID=2715852 RepID=A0A2K5R1X3_CEBIM
MGYIMAKKHLEINLNQPIVETLQQKAEVDKDNKAVRDLVVLPFQTVGDSQTYPKSVYHEQARFRY